MKKIMVTRSSMPDMDEYISEIRELWESHWLTNMGEKHKTLQRNLREYLCVDNLELFTNGHMAIELTLQAMKLKGEVITSPFTFASSTHAIVRNGLVPVFCDINENDYTIDTGKIESLITEKTSAILPIHVYGNVCDVEKIEKIAEKYGLKVIYDAAHAFGVQYKGRGIGAFGDASCFSFHATKVFNTIEGGATCFRVPELGTELYNLKNFGIKDEETVVEVGANAKMNEFQAAMGVCNLRHVEMDILKRREVYNRYVRNLRNIKGIKTNTVQEDVKPNYAYFPIFVDEKEYGVSRDALFAELKKHGVYTRKYFYPLTSQFDCYQGTYSCESTPIAKKTSEMVLTLPMYADLSMEDVDYVCEIIYNASLLI